MDFDEKLEELFIDLPEPPADLGSSVGAAIFGKLLCVGGVLPFSEGRIQYPGRVGVEVRLDNAKMAARLAAVMSVAVARRELGGSLSKIKRVLRVDGFVSCGADFRDHQKVLDGAGEFFVQVMGQKGRHVRTAVGASSLPQNACVEIAVMFELK